MTQASIVSPFYKWLLRGELMAKDIEEHDIHQVHIQTGSNKLIPRAGIELVLTDHSPSLCPQCSLSSTEVWRC